MPADKPFEPTGITADVLAFVRRRLSPKAPRQVSVQLGPLGKDPESNPLKNTTHRTLQGRINSLAQSLGKRAFETGRRERVGDYREIAEEVPELYRGLEVMVDFVFGGGDGEGPQLVFADGARSEVKRVAEAVWEGLQIPKVGRGMIHEGMWLGDSMTQPIYSLEDRAMVAERHWRPEIVTVWERGGILSHYSVDTGQYQEPLLLHPFEMVHYAHVPVRGAFYGRSLWHAARGVRRHHEAITDTATFLALKRASGDVFFLWPFPAELDEEKLDEWVSQAQNYGEFDTVFDSGGNLRKRAAASVETAPRILPFRVVDGVDTKPEPLFIPPTNLSQMVELMEHHQDRMFIAAGVPKSLVGLDRDVNAKATVEQQGLHFALTVRSRGNDAQRVMESFIWRGLMAAGIQPNPDEVRVEMPSASAFDEAVRARVAKDRAAAVKDLVDAGVPVEFALATAGGVSEEDVESVADDLAGATAAAVEKQLERHAG